MEDQNKTNNLLASATQEIRQVVIEDDAEAATEFLVAIKERLQANRSGMPAEERMAWQQLEQQLYWVLFLQQPWDRCVELFRTGLGAIVEFMPGVDVIAKLTAKLILEDDLAIRDQYREKIRKALLDNIEKLTASVRVQTNSVDGAINVWLGQYINAVGSGATDQLAYQQWLAQDPLLSALKPIERERVEWLTKLYEELKHSSQAMDGLEEGIYTTDERGRPAYYHRGQFRLIDPDGAIRRKINAMKQATGATPAPAAAPTPTPTLPARPIFKAPPLPVTPRVINKVPSAPVAPTLAAPTTAGQWSQSQIVARYQGDQTKAAAVANRGAALQQTTHGDPAAGRDALFAAINAVQPDEVEIVAALQLLASTDVLDDILRDDNRFTQVVSQALERQGNINRLNDLKLYPKAPQFIQFFLELVLQQKIGLAEDEAARWGLQLANALKRAGNDKYSQIAYFDVADGKFHWRR